MSRAHTELMSQCSLTGRRVRHRAESEQNIKAFYSCPLSEDGFKLQNKFYCKLGLTFFDNEILLTGF